MSSETLYRKVGRKYVPVHETPHMYTDGVWLVQGNGNRQQCILKLGELKELYPFADLVVSQQESIIRFLALYPIKQADISFVNKDGFIVYQLASNQEFVLTLLKFIAASETEKEEMLTYYKQHQRITADGYFKNDKFQSKLKHYDYESQYVTTNMPYALMKEHIADRVAVLIEELEKYNKLMTEVNSLISKDDKPKKNTAKRLG